MRHREACVAGLVGPQDRGAYKEEDVFFSKGFREPWKDLKLGRMGFLDVL